MIDYGYALFEPALDLVKEWLNIEITFFNVTFPIWAILVFSLLVGLFFRFLVIVSGINFDIDEPDNRTHIGGFYDR